MRELTPSFCVFYDILLFPDAIDEQMREACLFWRKKIDGQGIYDQLSSVPTRDLEERSSKLRKACKIAETLKCF